MLAWLIDKVRWLLLIAAVGGPALAYYSWSDAERIRDVETNGVEAVAVIEGATRTQRRRGGTSYSLDLAWKDSKGGVRKAEKVGVSRAFADQIVRNDKLTRDAVRIKYLRDDPTVTPVLVEDANRQEEQDAFMVQAGVGAGAVGIAGSALMLLLRRRRQTAEA
jgi:hypothetical protein